jgi:hypothetical protein
MNCPRRASADSSTTPCAPDCGPAETTSTCTGWPSIPVIGTEIRKTRPAVIVSNDSCTRYDTRVVLPLTSHIDSLIAAERLRGAGLGDALKPGGAARLDIPPAGWRRPDGSHRVGNGNDIAAALWTATKANDEEAWHRDLSSARTGIWRSPVPFAYSLSVRCVKNQARRDEAVRLVRNRRLDELRQQSQ